ncbi:MAG: ABC transporter ATP-binding protein [Lachnospiraceae bacterium]|nr:ABC transporter ATP-binding protein [Lachnospiraceae bacterium]
MLLYFCGKGYIQNTTLLGETITSGVLVSFYMYIHTFFNPIQNLADMFNRLQSAFASAEKIFTVMDMEPEVQDSEDAIEIDHFKGEIEFRHVWFRYEDTDVTAVLRGDMDEGAIEGHGGEIEETEAMKHHTPEGWILKDVSFHVKPGETVAFVGATGAGKTTILSLVCRNYDIQKGEILIDGIDIRKIKLSSLRSHFGQMLQDVFLFSGTIRSNIVLREESFTDDDVNAACRYVNADRFISKLPNGLDEEVRERGNNFSAGQRQLLSFARTVIHKPDIMILDEATANIDTETEVLIQDSLEKMMNIGTMLIVAHRLSTIQHADRIIVINHGEIVESGNHFELLEKRGAYYKLYKLQYEAE